MRTPWWSIACAGVYKMGTGNLNRLWSVLPLESSWATIPVQAPSTTFWFLPRSIFISMLYTNVLPVGKLVSINIQTCQQTWFVMLCLEKSWLTVHAKTYLPDPPGPSTKKQCPCVVRELCTWSSTASLCSTNQLSHLFHSLHMVVTGKAMHWKELFNIKQG